MAYHVARRLADRNHQLAARPARHGRHPGGLLRREHGDPAALWAAANPRLPVPAIVSRCGRPDLAGRRLALVQAPTLQPAVTAVPAAAGCPAAPYGAGFYAPGGSKTVALTFDDGPGKSTAAILAILARYRVPATFFNIGVNMPPRASLVREEVKGGYAMGNHTWNHPDMAALSAARQAAEQRSIAGTVPCAYRPPYGGYDPATLRLAQQRRMGVWLWSVDIQDWMADGSGSS